MQLQSLRQERPHLPQQLLACRLAAHVDVAVIDVATESVATALKFAIPVREQDVRQQRRERPALWRAFAALCDQPITH
ncbi:hypothetical protein FQZ97_1260360 [compost metagenome]